MYSFEDLQKTARAQALAALDTQTRIVDWQIEQIAAFDDNSRQGVDAARAAFSGGLRLVQDAQRLWLDAILPEQSAPAS